MSNDYRDPHGSGQPSDTELTRIPELKGLETLSPEVMSRELADLERSERAGEKVVEIIFGKREDPVTITPSAMDTDEFWAIGDTTTDVADDEDKNWLDEEPQHHDPSKPDDFDLPGGDHVADSLFEDRQ
jgi:hypothetical protein